MAFQMSWDECNVIKAAVMIIMTVSPGSEKLLIRVEEHLSHRAMSSHTQYLPKSHKSTHIPKCANCNDYKGKERACDLKSMTHSSPHNCDANYNESELFRTTSKSMG